MKPEAFGQFNAFRKYNAKNRSKNFQLNFSLKKVKTLTQNVQTTFLKPEKQKSDSIMRTKQMIYVMAFYGKTNVNLIISFFLLSF